MEFDCFISHFGFLLSVNPLRLSCDMTVDPNRWKLVAEQIFRKASSWLKPVGSSVCGSLDTASRMIAGSKVFLLNRSQRESSATTSYHLDPWLRQEQLRKTCPVRPGLPCVSRLEHGG